ncbi:MAG TPA: LamG-like jellyroll fold domain-containing protein [Phycisphaerae bacterium]|nr:LamG-like jellyroll fold domain-containing protein [Phycisphaerae bacterium]
MRWMVVAAAVCAVVGVGVMGICFGQAVATRAGGAAAEGRGEGLLFYLSGEKGTVSDVGFPGTETPTVVRGVRVIPDGAVGKGFSNAGTQVMAYWAGGNVYAQRGTLSFFWRAREAVGPTPFPIFRVAYADSSTWDMAWLRIDYNGHGYDAFVTDADLARERVSATVDPFPKASEWTHLALAWDENVGVRLYVNGKLAGEKLGKAVLDTGLDQFGPFSRIISPHQVQSDYNYIRGGDIDEVRFYDRMISAEAVGRLAKGEDAGDVGTMGVRTLADPAVAAEWGHRYGWDKSAPPELPGKAGETVSVRKVEIHDAYDLKRWWWKGIDGIRETTWPGVYNRSRLPGRTDYFVLPDWDCYSGSGKAITFVMPDEEWNWVEMWGSAWGKMEVMGADAPATVETNDPQIPAKELLFTRAQGEQKTVNAVAVHKGGKIRFTNEEIEEPIGEMGVYDVKAGAGVVEPAGSAKKEFVLNAADGLEQVTGPGVEEVTRFIEGRYPADERAVMVGGDRPRSRFPGGERALSLPLVHVVIPDTWDDVDGGLDGIAIDLPAMAVRPTNGGTFAMNVRVKDPLWVERDMLDFTFSEKPGEARTLWLDLRDRMLPAGKALYLTIASSAPEFGAEALEGAKVRLVFKPKEAAKAEHVADRFTQARDCYAMLVEEHPKLPRLKMWVRFEGDLRDLLRVDPENVLGKQYAWAARIQGAQEPAYTLDAVPAGVPGWAYRQTELLGRLKHFVNFYIDDRQIADGEFGGGLSDDTDLTNTWPGVALMGCDPEKLRESLRRELEACYANGMFTNGVPTNQMDELHSYEEGINCLSENLILNFGNPRDIERAMETQKGMERVTGINPAGHRLFRTSYYSATKMATEDPWGFTKGYSYLVIQPGQLLVDYNGNPEAKKVLVELADGLLAHRHVDANGRGTTAEVIKFATDEEQGYGRRWFPWHVFWGAWEWTGDKKYLAPLMDGGAASLSGINANVLDLLDLRKTWGEMGGGRGGRGGGRGGLGGGAGGGNQVIAWQLDGDKTRLERLFASQVQTCDLMDFINTQGSLWIDRVNVPITDVQRARLGGVALVRNSLYPGNTVSWEFQKPANDQSVGILIPDATRTGFKVIAYNLEDRPVTAVMRGANVDPGQWEMTQGVDTNGDDAAEGEVATREVKFEQSVGVAVTFAPRVTTVLTMKLKTPGTPYWQRPDLGISREDVVMGPRTVRVTVHSLGSVDAPAGVVRVLDRAGKELGRVSVPALKGVVDLTPVRETVAVSVGDTREVGRVVVEGGGEEITKMNNSVEVAK